MATVKYYGLHVPTQRQSRYVKFAEFGILPNVYTPRIKAGKFEGIDCHYKIKTFQVYLTCDANVANRTIDIQIAQRTPNALSGAISRHITGNITASQTGRIIYNSIGTLVGVTLTGLNVNGSIEIGDLFLIGEDEIQITIANAQAADSLNITGLFEYRNYIDNILEA